VTGRPLLRWLVPLLAAIALAGCGNGASQQREVELGGETAETAPARTEPEAGEPTETAPPPSDGRAPLLDERAAKSFDAFAERLGGEAGITVGVPGDPEAEQLGSLTTGSAWSTIKVAIAARVLEQVGGPDGLSAEQEGLIRSALTASDNAAADELFASLGGGDSQAAGATGEVLAEAGDTTTQVSAQGRDGFSPYGQTEWPLVEQHRFMARLAGGCLGDAAGSEYLLSLMGDVVPDQRWGLGSAGAESARFKGGWGPGTDGRYLVRQMGVVEFDGKEVVVTLATVAPDGQFASGTQALTKLAGWVAENVDTRGATPARC